MNKKSNTKIDWDIHGYTDVDGMINMHTHGLADKGLMELSSIAGEWECTPEDMASKINTVAQMMVDGEKFTVDSTLRHVIDDADGNPKFKFTMSYAYCEPDALDVENKRMKTIRLKFLK